jgi:hypothetical protein
MRKFIFIVMVLLPLAAEAQVPTTWNKFEERSNPKDSAIVLQIGSDPNFGFTRAWHTTGLGPNWLEPLTSDIATLSKDGFFGEIRIFEGRGVVGFEETTASARVRALGFWKDKPVEPSSNGSFMFNNAQLRWIGFPYKAKNGVAFECAGYVASGRGAKFDLSGYWCTGNARAMGEADVLGFVNAIGYKDLLVARPLDKLPGK